jgi:predicted enzyme related to lactoylglutathione lyase
MIAGAHFLLYSNDPEADRAFFKTVLEFPSIDLGEGWLIFNLPPAELAVHPGDGEFVQLHAEHPMLGAVLYLMCDDLGSVIERLKSKGVTCAKPVEAEWGISTSIRLPSGGEIGLYQPTHPTMITAGST